MYFKRIFNQVFWVTILISSCVSALYMPAEKDATMYQVPLDSLIKGRELYTLNCTGCHNLYLPAGYSTEEWPKILERMQEPAKIDSNQKNLIFMYLNVSLQQATLQVK